MIYLIGYSEGLNVGLENNVSERFEEVKDEPCIDHFDVGSLANAYKHGRKDKHDSNIQGDDCLKEEGFEIICRVSNQVKKKSWDEDSKNNAQKTPTKYQFHNHFSCCSYNPVLL